MKAAMKNRKHKVYVDTYHIDTQGGLNLFVEILKEDGLV